MPKRQRVPRYAIVAAEEKVPENSGGRGTNNGVNDNTSSTTPHHQAHHHAHNQLPGTALAVHATWPC